MSFVFDGEKRKKGKEMKGKELNAASRHSAHAKETDTQRKELK